MDRGLTLTEVLVAIGLLIFIGAAFFLTNDSNDSPRLDESKNYVGNSREECSRIQVTCVAGFERFDDALGCGCREVKDSENTALIVTNFEECVAAGNPVMESYPRQCRHSGQNFVEEIGTGVPTIPGSSKVVCEASQRDVLCTQQYQPVCGLVNVQCITSPCPPVEQTFSNGCVACSNQLVESYTEGECSI